MMIYQRLAIDGTSNRHTSDHKLLYIQGRRVKPEDILCKVTLSDRDTIDHATT